MSDTVLTPTPPLWLRPWFTSSRKPALTFPLTSWVRWPSAVPSQHPMFPSSTTQIKVQLSEHTSCSPKEQKCLADRDFATLECSSAWQEAVVSKWRMCEWMNEWTQMSELTNELRWSGKCPIMEKLIHPAVGREEWKGAWRQNKPDKDSSEVSLSPFGCIREWGNVNRTHGDDNRHLSPRAEELVVKWENVL